MPVGPHRPTGRRCGHSTGHYVFMCLAPSFLRSPAVRITRIPESKRRWQPARQVVWCADAQDATIESAEPPARGPWRGPPPGGAFLISRKVGGPGLLRLREGGRKQKQKTEGAQGPRASRRLRVGVRKGPALQIHLRRGSKDPKYFTLGIWKCFQSLKATPFFVVLHYSSLCSLRALIATWIMVVRNPGRS